MLWREPLASVLRQRAVLPESTLEHPAGRPHLDLGIPESCSLLARGSERFGDEAEIALALRCRNSHRAAAALCGFAWFFERVDCLGGR